MNRFVSIILAALLIAGCNAAPDPATPAASTPTAATSAPTPAPTGQVKRASATGVVQSVDVEAKSITIAHGPVDALGWPGMTMAFEAPGVDLATIKAGDNVSFEFDSSGMDGTIVSIARQ